MEKHKRHERIWRFLYALLHRAICRLFRLEPELCFPDGPSLVVSNHVTDWDPLLLAMSFPKNSIYFVASEHLFRQGLVSRLLYWVMQPIARRKASVGTDTVRACLRHLKDGHTVCVFAEGDASWDGRTGNIFPATGKLARSSGATLITYRLEGGYLSRPRWSSTIRRGKMTGHPIKAYPPEVLKTMRPEEITRAIEEDIREDAWERQREAPISYKGKRLAECLEKALFFCPRCRKSGTLHSEGDILSCSCGLKLRYLETGFFEPAEPFETIAQWEDWQQRELREMRVEPGQVLFSDDEVSLTEIEAEHRTKALAKGKLLLFPDRLCLEEREFPLEKISNMAMVQTHLLLFSFQEHYYELRAGRKMSFRKYLAWWKNNVTIQE